MPQERDVPRTRQAEAELRMTASPEEAYAAWADPSGIAAWFVDGARRRRAHRARDRTHAATRALTACGSVQDNAQPDRARLAA